MAFRDEFPADYTWAFDGPGQTLNSFELADALRRRTGRTISPHTIRRIRHLRRREAATVAGATHQATGSGPDRPGARIDPINGTATLTGMVDDYDIDSLLRRHKLNPDEWEITGCTINHWTGQLAGNTGQLDHQQLKIQLRRKIVYELLLPAPRPQVFFAPKPSPKAIDAPRLILVTTDSQIPFQHEALHQLSCQFAHDMQVDEWIDLGDFLDLPSLSRFREKPSFSASLQESIDTGGRILHERTTAAPPHCRKRKVDGNHEARSDNYILDKAREFYGVKRYQIGPPEHESVLALDYLMRSAELGWEYETGYPYNEIVITPGLTGYHGNTYKSGSGASVRAELARRTTSLIMGHVNYHSINTLTRKNEWGEIVTVYGVEAGLMCTREGSLGFGHPAPDWSLGFTTVTVWPDGHFNIELVPFDGRAIAWRDRRWTVASLV